MRIVSEQEFNERITALALALPEGFGSVTGPGRSGAVAAVYVSHILRIPFIPYGATVPAHLGRLLIADTAQQSGETIRKACRRYRSFDPGVVVAFLEPPRVAFWYEACNPKPQFYRHEEKVIQNG